MVGLVDWDKPIEAVHRTSGKVVLVTLDEVLERMLGIEKTIIYRTHETPNPSESNHDWYPDGSDMCHYNRWYIRNREEMPILEICEADNIKELGIF